MCIRTGVGWRGFLVKADLYGKTVSFRREKKDTEKNPRKVGYIK